MADDIYPWTRRDEESHPAYEAFRVYLKVRSTTKTAEEIGKSTTLTTRWCAQHSWVERVTAYDRHIARAETDGHAEDLTRVRHKQLVLIDKLLDHLDSRLDEIILKKWDPPKAWTDAFVAATKAQLEAVRLREVNVNLNSRIDDVMERLERIQSGAV